MTSKVVGKCTETYLCDTGIGNYFLDKRQKGNSQRRNWLILLQQNLWGLGLWATWYQPNIWKGERAGDWVQPHGQWFNQSCLHNEIPKKKTGCWNVGGLPRLTQLWVYCYVSICLEGDTQGKRIRKLSFETLPDLTPHVSHLMAGFDLFLFCYHETVIICIALSWVL